MSVAADSGLDLAVADSVGSQLASGDKAREAWMADSTAWEERLTKPFLLRVRDRLHLRVEPECPLRR